jgi:hypothetical protein
VATIRVGRVESEARNAAASGAEVEEVGAMPGPLLDHRREIPARRLDLHPVAEPREVPADHRPRSRLGEELVE